MAMGLQIYYLIFMLRQLGGQQIDQREARQRRKIFHNQIIYPDNSQRDNY